MEMKFEPISHENIEEAIALAHLVFPNDVGGADDAALAYVASLDPDKHRDLWEGWDSKSLEYWVVREGENIVGATGLYTRTIDQNDVVWLGWYFVAPSRRGEGYGRKILEWTMNEARERRYKIMKLYTSNDPNEAAAQSRTG